MLIDLHEHSGGISTCCRADVITILDRAKAVGLDGIVLTNHYTNLYYDEASYSEWIERYIAEYEKAKAYGATIHCRVFLGAEISMCAIKESLHLLLYGVTPAFLRENPRLCELDQQTLYTLAHQNGLLLVQAHPYRSGNYLLDTDYLDGIELNCHPKHTTHSDTLPALAHEKGLLLTCGGDYHADVAYRPVCGAFLPDTIQDERALADYLQNAKELKLRVHETDGRSWHDLTYRR